MNQTKTNTQEIKQTGFFKRIGTAVAEALFNWLCQCEMGLSPNEAQLFTYHSGLGCEEAASYYYFANAKRYEEPI
ncbi:MAG: hypothetical protein KC445_01550 [Anaerolineales bacterium]|nr:hypothetical protein [Anaerolineales bacterium]